MPNSADTTLSPMPEQVHTAPIEIVPVKKPRRNLRSAKAAGSWMEKITAEFLAFRLADDRIERRTKNGKDDRGDITGVKTIRGGRVCLEVKDYGGKFNVTEWLREAAVEAGNDDAVIAAVVAKRRGVAAPSEQVVFMTLETFARLLLGGPDEGRGI